jgi:hypothetical protein
MHYFAAAALCTTCTSLILERIAGSTNKLTHWAGKDSQVANRFVERLRIARPATRSPLRDPVFAREFNDPQRESITARHGVGRR